MANTKKLATALEAEATGKDLPCVFRGITLVVPSGDDMPISAMRAYERGHLVTCCEELLGPEQWKRVEAAGATTAKDLRELLQIMFRDMGTSTGE